jgi:hypothetical protein
MQKKVKSRPIPAKEIMGELKAHIKMGSYIPSTFYKAYYKSKGRQRGNTLESMLWYLVLQSLIGIVEDNIFLFMVRLCDELREFIGFGSVPDAGKVSTFKQVFAVEIGKVFEEFVEATEPMCRELDGQKAGYLIYDPTGVEAYVKENNPKYLNGKLTNAKKVAAKNPAINAHALAYSQMPEFAAANPFAQQQYINGYFCYAVKAGILANGLGIIRGISVFDDRFKKNHPEVVSQKTDNPELDKEIADSSSLKPVLDDFFDAHPTFSYHTFLGDASFDSYDTYPMLRDHFKFERMCIPLNPRNSAAAHQDFNGSGTPVCPIDKTPFHFLAPSKGKNRSLRFKFVCHLSRPVTKSDCQCLSPCTLSPYGRCVYTYPHKNLRLYPGIPRDTQHWDNLYRHRVLIERSIYLLKYPLGAARRTSLSPRTIKADLFVAGIAHLVGLILAFRTNKNDLFKSVRSLFSA